MSVVCLVFLMVFAVVGSKAVAADSANRGKDHNAIVVASFGTTVPKALVSITNIVERVRVAYPNTEVRLTFTSNIIRSVWKKRRAEAQKWLDQGVPEEVLYVDNIITTLGKLREDGYKNIIVQPTHMFFMEQSHDLQQYVNGLAGIRTMKEKWRPFRKLVMARPALGMPGDLHDYHEDIHAAVATLAGDAKLAEDAGALLVYMGHGNAHWSTGIYGEVRKEMRKTYPEVETFIGVVEGFPGIEDIVDELKRSGKKKILLKPFMIVAGDHAVNDMSGPEEDSWKMILTREGYEVEPVLEGLGSNDAFADLFVKHIEDTAHERGIELK